ncbi:MAG: patatin-like phospholipase family protein, partial [Pseudomonadota bacterium]
KPELKIAHAVTASAAFPPVLSPFKLRVKPEDFDIREAGVDDSFLRDVTLTDGGVYDNYGLEPIWKRFRTVLVSDGGAALPMQSRIFGDWVTQLRRVVSVIQSQVHALRSRSIVEQYLMDERQGAFWSIATPPSRFDIQPYFEISDEAALAIAQIPTRLKAMSADQQELLINFGYVQADNAIRSYYRIGADRGSALPFPERSM